MIRLCLAICLLSPTGVSSGCILPQPHAPAASETAPLRAVGPQRYDQLLDLHDQVQAVLTADRPRPGTAAIRYGSVPVAERWRLSLTAACTQDAKPEEAEGVRAELAARLAAIGDGPGTGRRRLAVAALAEAVVAAQAISPGGSAGDARDLALCKAAWCAALLGEKELFRSAAESVQTLGFRESLVKVASFALSGRMAAEEEVLAGIQEIGIRDAHLVAAGVGAAAGRRWELWRKIHDAAPAGAARSHLQGAALFQWVSAGRDAGTPPFRCAGVEITDVDAVVLTTYAQWLAAAAEIPNVDQAKAESTLLLMLETTRLDTGGRQSVYETLAGWAAGSRSAAAQRVIKLIVEDEELPAAVRESVALQWLQRGRVDVDKLGINTEPTDKDLQAPVPKEDAAGAQAMRRYVIWAAAAKSADARSRAYQRIKQNTPWHPVIYRAMPIGILAAAGRTDEAKQLIDKDPAGKYAIQAWIAVAGAAALRNDRPLLKEAFGPCEAMGANNARGVLAGDCIQMWAERGLIVPTVDFVDRFTELSEYRVTVWLIAARRWGGLPQFPF